ncbi:hypothetical protein J4456_02000 [Candidatus Pacearchaeota archaeon]|nr:hypothetical protein [Candidatus Pacearchaeota archaeon]
MIRNIIEKFKQGRENRKKLNFFRENVRSGDPVAVIDTMTDFGYRDYFFYEGITSEGKISLLKRISHSLGDIYNPIVDVHDIKIDHFGQAYMISISDKSKVSEGSLYGQWHPDYTEKNKLLEQIE